MTLHQRVITGVFLALLLTGFVNRQQSKPKQEANYFVFDLRDYSSYVLANSPNCPLSEETVRVEIQTNFPHHSYQMKCKSAETERKVEVVNVISKRNELPPSRLTGYRWHYVDSSHGDYPYAVFVTSVKKTGADYALVVEEHPLNRQGVQFFELYRSK
ncbi:hypothetical protein [Vibrio chaetopteri]|uniref:Lipoprotein n=1 Tax=Vibrio chaetopteri TaxID=3016528 RepID=A0AAU8BRQ8_9VIBR